MVCEVDTKGFDVKVEVIKDGNVVRIEHVPSVAHLPLRTVRYTIPSMSQNDTGAYSCRASNEYGNDTSKEGILTMEAFTPFVTGSRNNSNACDVQLDPCQNGGTCRTDGYNVTCECVLGYTGALCNIAVPSQPQTNTSDTPDNNAVIASVVVVGVILMIVLGVVVVILSRRQRRGTFQASASYSDSTSIAADCNNQKQHAKMEGKLFPGNAQSTV